MTTLLRVVFSVLLILSVCSAVYRVGEFVGLCKGAEVVLPNDQHVYKLCRLWSVFP